jgi:hypothetical protein
MKASRGLQWTACLLSAGLVTAGCSKNNPSPDGGGADGGGTDAGPCVVDTDCPDPTIFFCNSATGVCEPSCRQASDCLIARRTAQYALPYCDNAPLKCVCDNGVCVPTQCSVDGDCGSGNACRDGNCVPLPTATTIASCQITPDVVVTSRGATATFFASFADSSGKPVVVPSGITWSAKDGSVTLNGSATGDTAVFNAVAAAGAATPSGVQVQVGSATCQAKVIIVDASQVPANKVEVVVTDELNGRPVPGATVITLDSGGNQLDMQTSAADGTATLSATGTISVTAFHTDFSYLTIAGYSTAGSASRLLSMVVRRNPLDQLGGYAGTFTDLPQAPNVLAGLASASLAGSIADLDFNQVIGTSVKTQVSLGTAFNGPVDLPVGTFLQFIQNPLKSTDAAAGLAGVCTDTFAGGSGMAEPLITSGQCGTRTAWALEGNLDIGDLPISALTSGLKNIDWGGVLTQLQPAFKKFNSSVGRDVQFKLNPYDGGFDTSQFATYNHDFAGVPLGFGYVVQVPTLPQFQGQYLDGVLVVPGSNVPGRGIVPLGLGAGVDSTPATVSTTDVQAQLPAPGLILVRSSPLHGGLEGFSYGIGMAAVQLATIQTNLVASAILYRVPGNKLTFDLSGNNPITMPMGFVAVPENAKFNAGTNALPSLPLRTFKFAAAPNTTGLNVMRVQFQNSAGHTWTVMADVASPTFTLPTPPGTPVAYEDRVYDTNSPGSQKSTMLVQMIGLSSTAAAGGNPIAFTQLVELGSTNADRLTDLTTAFSVDSYGRPKIAWTTPSSAGSTILHGTNVTVTVTNFLVGLTATADGIVRLSFTGGTGCTGTVDGTVDTSGGQGQISIQLPQGCTGTNMTLTATLYDNEGTPQPISPAVSASIGSITIN